MPQQRDELDDLLDGPDTYDDLDELLGVSPKKRSRWGDYVGMAIRGLGGFVGNAGGFIGAGAAGIGDAVAQGFERFGGSRESFSGAEIAANAAVGAVPFGKIGKGAMALAKGYGKGALTAAANAGAIDAIQQHEQEGKDWSDLDWNRSASAAKVGGVVGLGGAGLGHLAEKFLGRGGASTVKGRRWDPTTKTFVSTAEPTIQEVAEAANPFPSLQRRGQKAIDVNMPSPGRAALDPNAPVQGDPLVVAEQNWTRRSKATPVTRRSQIEGIEPEIVTPNQDPQVRTPNRISDNADVTGELDQPFGPFNQGTRDPLLGTRVPRRAPAHSLPSMTTGAGEALDIPGSSHPQFEGGQSRLPFFGDAGNQLAEFEARQHQLTKDAMQDTIDKLARTGKYAPEHVELDPELPAPAPSRTNNASGESAASMEAISRTKGMRDRKETFVVYDRAGNRKVVGNDVAAVDYAAREGETFGIEKADGSFQKLDDRGGRAPKPTVQDETAGAGRGPSTGRPRIPAEIHALHESLKPKWAADSAKQRLALGTHGDVDLVEDLGSFTKRIFGEENDRNLFGAERKAKKAALARDPDVASGWKKLFGDDSGAGGEGGFIDPELARKLGTHVGGAATGATVGALASDDETRSRNMIGGAVLGALGPLAFTKGGQDAAKSAAETLGKLRYFSMLGSVSAQGKNILGNSGATVVRAAEELAAGNAEGAKSLLGEVFSGKTLDDVIDAYKHAPATDTRWGSNTGVLGFFSRLMHAIDEGVVSGMERGGLSHDEAKLSTLTSDPRSATGKWLANRPEAMSAVVPFVRTAANLLERGLEHTPGVGMLPQVRAMRPEDSLRRVLARQGLGAAALTAGAVAGGDNPYVSAFMGPLAVPYAAGVAGKEAWDKRGDGLKNITAAELELLESLIPLPSGSFTSPYDLERYLASYVPSVLKDASLVDPRDFKTGETIFDQSIAKVPFLNEALLKRKARRAEKR